LLSVDSDASPFERELVDAGRARQEPQGMEARVLAAVTAAATTGAAAKTTVALEPSAAEGTKGAELLGAVTKGKILVATVALAAAGTTAYVAMRTPTSVVGTTPATAAPAKARGAGFPAHEGVAPSNETANAPPLVRPEELPNVAEKTSTPSEGPLPPRALSAPHAHALPAAAPSATGASPAPTQPTSSASSEQLREEAALVEQARAALNAGDVNAARERLALTDRRFPSGRLQEERDALEIRVVAASGDASRAASMARAFLSRYPSSPAGASIRKIAERQRVE
jgi:hypothetical protein